MSVSLRNIILLITIALSNASPFQLSKRQDQFPSVPFSSTTCGTQPELNSLNLSTTLPAVDVKQDCDTTIDAICKWVDYATTQRVVPQSYRHITGECEGHIIYPLKLQRYPVTTPGPDYATCVKGFQSITVNCMLPQESFDSRQQYGVQNVKYTPPPSDLKAGEKSNLWSYRDSEDDKPGYMIGAQRAFGDEAKWWGTGYDLPKCDDGSVHPVNEKCNSPTGT
ncbi:MAG: hypothetical protein Q9199_005889 [Rusavskia elegans]